MIKKMLVSENNRIINRDKINLKKEIQILSKKKLLKNPILLLKISN